MISQIFWNPFCLYTHHFYPRDESGIALNNGIYSKYPSIPVQEIQIFITGTIYNIEEIAADLLLSSEDTREILATLYHKVGEHIPCYLEGTYAIVILDGKKLLMFRDKYSIENLFFFRDDMNKSFIISSSIYEIKKLKNLEVNKEVLPQAFLCNLIDYGKTLFKNIGTPKNFELLMLDRTEGRWTTKPYDEFAYHPVTDRHLDDASIVEETECILSKTLKRISTAYSGYWIGNSLSGGTDSSLLQALLKRQGYNTSYTVCHAPPNGNLTEKYARDIAMILQTDHHVIRVPSGDLLRNMEEGIRIVAQPFVFEGEVLFQGINKAVADDAFRHDTNAVFLNGSGADTVIGHGLITMELKYLSRPGIRAIFSIFNHLFIQILSPKAFRRYRMILKAIDRNRFDAEFLLIFLNDEDRISLIKEAFQLSDLSQIYEYQSAELQKYEVPLLEKIYRLQFFHGELIRESNIYYQTAKSQNILETFPFMDSQLITFYFNIPTERKIRYFTFKYFLKRLLQKYLPRKYIYRKKIPLHAETSFNGICKQQKEYEAIVEEIKRKRYPYFNFDLDAIFNNEKYGTVAISLINFHLWYIQFIDT